jgi:hypothetical protein
MLLINGRDKVLTWCSTIALAWYSPGEAKDPEEDIYTLADGKPFDDQG